tara:strand:+ start:37 stop:1920 length:1884 start_codon:yes stop_codon:yes gene_type:complete
MSKLGLIVAIFVATVLTSRPVFPSTNQLNAAPNDDVIAGIKALHRSPEKEMAKLRALLDSNSSSPKRHEWLYLYALGKEKRGEYNEALTLAESCINDVYASSLMQQRAKLLKAKILSRTGEIQEAISLLNAVKQWSMNHGVIQLNIGVLMTLGAAFEKIKEPKLALDNYLSAYNLATQFKTQVPPSHIAGLIGNIYLKQSKFEEAKAYLDEAYEFAVKKKNSVNQSYLAEKLARTELGLSNFKTSAGFFNLAIDIAGKNNDSPLLANALLGKGKMLLAQNNAAEVINTARTLFEEASDIARHLESKTIYFESLIELSRLALSNGDKTRALEKVRLAEEVIANEEPGFPHLEAAYLKLSILEAFDNKQETIDALKQYIALNELITESMDKSRVQIIRTLYELDEIEAENSDLKAVTQLQEEKLTLNQQRNFLLAVIAGLFLLLSVLLFLLYVKRARYQKRLERLATTDGLTRFYNRPKILELLNGYLNQLEITGEKFCVAMIDIDFFKSINDNYGHKMGDDALSLFAHTARQLFPKHVDMGRLGGEEFLFIFHNTEERQIYDQLDNFRQLLKTASSNQLSKDITLTFSAGLKTIKSLQTTTAILENADIALYEAKETGRDKTVMIKCL